MPTLPALETLKPHRPDRLAVRAGACSVQGARRGNNEDCEFVSPDLDLFIVADGMGGHAAGECASRFAVDALANELGHFPDEMDDSEIEERLCGALERANCLILDFSEGLEGGRRPGTTVVLALLVGKRLYITGVGDSRAYLVRNGRIERLTTDDTLPDHLLKEGVLSEEEARQHTMRNVLLRVLGSAEFKPDHEIRVLELQSGDRVLLATDGLTDTLSQSALAEIILRSKQPQQAADALAQAAIDEDAGDDLTCVTFFVSDHAGEPGAAAAAERVSGWQKLRALLGLGRSSRTPHDPGSSTSTHAK